MFKVEEEEPEHDYLFFPFPLTMSLGVKKMTSLYLLHKEDTIHKVSTLVTLITYQTPHVLIQLQWDLGFQHEFWRDTNIHSLAFCLTPAPNSGPSQMQNILTTC